MSRSAASARRRRVGSIAAVCTNVLISVSRVGTEGVDRGRDRSIRSDGNRGRDQQLRFIELAGSVLPVDGGSVEPAEEHVSAGDLQIVRGDGTVTDADSVESAERLPRVGEEIVADLGLAVSEPRADPFGHEQRIAAAVDGCGDEGRDRRSLTFGEQRHVGLVFDLVAPVDGDVPATGAVEDDPPELDEELAVPRVAAMDTDVDVASACGVGSGHGDTAAHLHLRGFGVDADRSQRLSEFMRRRRRIGRPEHEMHECPGRPTDRDRCQGPRGPGFAEDQSGQPCGADQPSTELAQRADEVRVGNGDRCRPGSERQRGERRCPVC